jgi:DNA-binding response OmpR family regulator
MRVLVVEDERTLAEVIARRLRREGMAVDLAHDGRTALYKSAVVDYDAIVLDRGLPEVHGDQVCRELVRREPPPRILMLTASGEVGDRISGLDLGADDYLAKPFSPGEHRGRRPPCPRCSPAVTWSSTLRAAASSAAAARSRSGARSSACSRRCCGPTGRW